MTKIKEWVLKYKFELIGYVLWMIVMFLIGLPGHKSFLTYLVGFLVVSGVYVVLLALVKKIHKK